MRNHPMKHESARKFTDSNLFMRLVGLASVLAGLALGKFFVWDVLEDAQNHAADIKTLDEAVMMVPFLVLMGLICIGMGSAALPLFKFNKRQLTTFQIIFLLIGVGLGLSLYIWLSSELSNLGYKD